MVLRIKGVRVRMGQFASPTGEAPTGKAQSPTGEAMRVLKGDPTRGPRSNPDLAPRLGIRVRNYIGENPTAMQRLMDPTGEAWRWWMKPRARSSRTHRIRRSRKDALSAPWVDVRCA